MAKPKTFAYFCNSCGSKYSKWQGQCHECEGWNTVVEIISSQTKDNKAIRLREFKSKTSETKQKTDLPFLDRLLGGGVPLGTTLLVAGEPGIGKSTLLFQMVAKQKGNVLYVSAEESVDQISRRFRGFQKNLSEGLYVLAENQIQLILKQIDVLKPQVVVIDSIQMILSDSETRAKGGMATLREVTETLVTKAKAMGIILWIVGHVNKDGDVAGPKTLEHLVDTVLIFSMGEDSRLRLLQTQKHRFGPSGEVALLEIDGTGLQEQKDANSYWSRSHASAVSGCALCPVLMGSRVFCVEVQALVVESFFSSSRRSTSGFDLNRLYLLLAVLEKRLKIPFSRFDVYLNIVGGLKVSDPAADLAVAAALLSAHSEKPVSMTDVFCGEIGLTGELRAVPAMSDRMRTASQLKKKVWIGASSKKNPQDLNGEFQVKQYDRLEDSLKFLF